MLTERTISPPSHTVIDYSWIENDYSDMRQPLDPFINQGIFPLLSYPKLKKIPTNVIKEIEKNVKHLQKKAEG